MKRKFYLLKSLCSPHFKKRYSFILCAAFFLSLSFSYTNKANAQAGEALNFDGVDDYVSVPYNVSGSYTKEAWINPSSLAGFPNILSGNNTALYINGGVLAAGHLFPYTDVQDITPIATATWTHVAVTYDAALQKMVLYKNGVAVATATSVAPQTDFLSYIGYLGVASTYFEGKIDEVRYWNVARTSSEIMASMSCSLTGDEFGLMAYYKFNQGVAGGTNTSITTLTDSQDKCFPYTTTTLNNFALTGTTSNFVAPGATLSGTCSGLFPNISLSGNGNCILSGDNTPDLTDFTNLGDFGYTAVSKTFVITNTGGANLNISSIVISGVNAADFTVTTPPASSVVAAGTTSFVITFNPGAPAGAKTATVTVNNNDLDEAAYSFEITGNNAGEGKSLNFDGIDDRVDLPFTLSGSYTKEAWVNSASFTSPSNILSGTDNALYAPDGNLSAGHTFPFTEVQDPVAMTVNTWYHVAVTYDASNGELKLFKNGTQVGTTATVAAYAATPLSIAAYGTGFVWSGLIDEVRVWKTVRTSAEIAANMNCQLTGDEPGLIAYYDFNQGAASGNNTGLTSLTNKADRCENYDGTLQNFALTGTTSNYDASTAVAATSCSGSFENISITGNGNCITLGNNTPSNANDTDFGPYIFPGISKTFTIVNSGNAALTISSIVISGVNAANFTLDGTVPTSVAANSSATFTVVFAATGSGPRNATITVNNSDADEAAYSFAVTGEATLITPVQLLSFDGYLQGENVNLQWKTATELNNSGFTIERATSVNGPWQPIAQVNSTNRLNGDQYNYLDANLTSGVYVYRLKQIDADGAYTFSKVIVFNLNNGKNAITIFPNPVKEVINIYSYRQDLLNTTYQVLSVDGKLMLAGKITATQTVIDCGGWKPGVYLIKFSTGSVERIIKQ